MYGSFYKKAFVYEVAQLDQQLSSYFFGNFNQKRTLASSIC